MQTLYLKRALRYERLFEIERLFDHLQYSCLFFL